VTEEGKKKKISTKVITKKKKKEMPKVEVLKPAQEEVDAQPEGPSEAPGEVKPKPREVNK